MADTTNSVPTKTESTPASPQTRRRFAGVRRGMRSSSLDDVGALKSAIATSFTEARPLAHNAFKIELAQRVVLRALQVAGGRA